jgi:flagellar motor switch protein FliN
MSEPAPKTNDPPNAEFDEISHLAEASDDRLTIADLNKMTLSLTADLGTCKMRVREVLELNRGSVVPLDKLAGEMADVYVNGLPLARGEIVVLGDTLHIRIGEVQGGTPRTSAGDGVDE